MVARSKLSPPLIAIVGPTATGKSDLAVKVALKFNGEIVSADSWLVRKGVDIGTAKPSKDVLKLVPHHLIDVIEPDADFTAARYKRLAQSAIDKILNRDRLPILVGGTGLYVDSVLYDYSFLPAGSPSERRRLDRMTLPELIDEAATKGVDLAMIDTRNKRRVIRAIETGGGTATMGQLRQNTLIVGLSADQSRLPDVIKQRVEHMLADGLEAEVASLNKRYGWNCEALKGIGYSEWREYFDGRQTLETTTERIIKDTLDLAKRQQTWFKRNKSIHWYATPVKLINVADLITTFLSKSM